MDAAERDCQVKTNFARIVQDNPDVIPAFAAIRALLDYLRIDKSTTLVGLMSVLRELKEAIMGDKMADASVSSGIELFIRFITMASLEKPEFEECKRVLIARGESYLQTHGNARDKLVQLCEPFITDEMTILTHARSRAVRDALIKAKGNGKDFHVLVTESAPDKSGLHLQKELRQAGISSQVILDAAVAYHIERVDCVLVGAEGVVENGGILNKIGSFSAALCAHTFNKPLYVLAERVKFMRLYPLSQQDIPEQFKFPSRGGVERPDRMPLVDYTPPRYITLLFTDLGILTPAAVSDELIQLYL